MEPFSTLQKIAIWIAILVGVFLLSDFLINVGMNSTYKNMERKRYIEIKDLKQEETQAFELLFRAKDTTSYKAEIVKEKEPGDELEIIPRELTQSQIVLSTILTLLIFWG